MQGNHTDCSKSFGHVRSGQIPWYLSNLLFQPSSQTPHRNLSKLDLHAWLLEPQQSRSRASLKQWQYELRLKEDQLDQSLLTTGYVTNFSTMRILLISWTAYRDRPKGRRGIPSWNLPLVLHQLAGLHWNPLKRPL